MGSNDGEGLWEVGGQAPLSTSLFIPNGQSRPVALCADEDSAIVLESFHPKRAGQAIEPEIELSASALVSRFHPKRAGQGV